tara:strand:+ start:600 stop:707 length:108 start_codon:yes stop_codon:yes gene_type:complete
MKSATLIIFLGVLYTIWAKAINKLEDKYEHKRKSS